MGSRFPRILNSISALISLVSSVGFATSVPTSRPAPVLMARELAAGKTRSYSFDINAEDISRGVLKGRYRYTTEITPIVPQNEAYEDTIEFDTDVTGPSTYTHLYFEENRPWISARTRLYEIGAHGEVLRSVADQICNVSPKSSSLPETLPFSKNPIVSLWLNCDVSAEQVVDLKSGHKLLFNFAAKMPIYLSIQPTRARHYRVQGFFQPQVDSVVAKISVVDNIFTMNTQTYKFQEMSHEGAASNLDQCDRVGAVKNVGALDFADGISVSRKEICYPSHNQKGFERIVVPFHNQPRNPNVQEATRIALEHAGHLAKKPLLQIKHLSEVNCHGYAVSAIVSKSRLGLPLSMAWLEGGSVGESLAESTGFSRGTYPFEAVLKENFHRVVRFNQVNGDFSPKIKALHDSRLKLGDLITMIDGGEYMHSGVLIKGKHPHELWIQSKLGEGPVVETPLQSLLDVYTTREIEIYRLN